MNKKNQFLQFLSQGYRALVWARLLLYQHGLLRQHTLPCPVISVGNITAGGTGKTPMVLYITQLLQQRGQRVVILTRGYRGKRTGTGYVLPVDGTADERQAGDEPALMAQKLQANAEAAGPAARVIVGRKRYRSGQLAIGRFQPDVLVLDDGFQHLALQRTFDLVLIDATDPFGGERVLPAGLLREPLGHLRRAHALVITRSDEVRDTAPLVRRVQALHPAAPLFTGRHVCDTLRWAGSNQTLTPETLADTRFLAVSGLGKPASFHRLLAGAGATAGAALDFPDHHWYTPQDAAAIRRMLATQHLDVVITTEKDERKLQAVLPASIRLAVVAIRLEVQPRAAFEQMVCQAAGLAVT